MVLYRPLSHGKCCRLLLLSYQRLKLFRCLHLYFRLCFHLCFRLYFRLYFRLSHRKMMYRYWMDSDYLIRHPHRKILHPALLSSLMGRIRCPDSLLQVYHLRSRHLCISVRCLRLLRQAHRMDCRRHLWCSLLYSSLSCLSNRRVIRCSFRGNSWSQLPCHLLPST